MSETAKLIAVLKTIVPPDKVFIVLDEVQEIASTLESRRQRIEELEREIVARDATIAQLVAACENALTAIEPIHSKGGMSLTIAAIKLRAAIDAAASDNEGETK